MNSVTKKTKQERLGMEDRGDVTSGVKAGTPYHQRIWAAGRLREIIEKIENGNLVIKGADPREVIKRLEAKAQKIEGFNKGQARPGEAWRYPKDKSFLSDSTKKRGRPKGSKDTKPRKKRETLNKRAKYA